MGNYDDIAIRAIALAEKWQLRSTGFKTPEERAFHLQMKKMVEKPLNKVFLSELIDKAFRPLNPFKTASLINQIISAYGIPNIFSRSERFLMFIFYIFGKPFAPIATRLVVKKIREKTANVILQGGQELISKHIKKRNEEKTKVNVNIIGELVLSEHEAMNKVMAYCDALANPEVNYLSIKISNIYSQIDSLDFESTVDILTERLTTIFLTAQKNTWVDEQQKARSKFVNLDMEEYRDLALTVAAFKKTLEKEEFKNFSAGIVLQAYIPDSFQFQKEITSWAQKRVKQGGAPIKIRIVKGANLDMEKTEASVRDWEQAPYQTKQETDANYKRMLLYALIKEHATSTHIGIASHNIFEIAFGFLVASEKKLLEFIDFEMLEGMSEGVRHVLLEAGLSVLLYTPVTSPHDFVSAIAYFVRRLDENTSPDNFLTHSFDLSPNGQKWMMLKDRFLSSVAMIDTVGETPRRRQDRTSSISSDEGSNDSKDVDFRNEPDTDWTSSANRAWAHSIRKQWHHPVSMIDERLTKIPVVINGNFVYHDQETLEVKDINSEVVIANCSLASKNNIDTAISVAKTNSEWRLMSDMQRHDILSKVAVQLKKKRADLIGVAAAEVGKLFTEIDTEISEAIDFAVYYPLSMQAFTDRKNLSITPRGTGLIIPPWNFPIAIPAGGIIASLVAGNNTIIKPAPQSVYCAYMLCQAFWEAGVPGAALQFIPAKNDPEGTYLFSHPDIDFTIFTGSTKTGMFMLEKHPNISLYAETGGKNATIVMDSADKDLAIKNIVRSAFGNTGQKCSATSLLILEETVFNSSEFKLKLINAILSLQIGYSWNFGSKIGPLVNPPLQGPLEKVLNSHDPLWLVKPKLDERNNHFLSPGLLWGIDEEHFTFKNELFGPILSVMCAKDLKTAVNIVNQTSYGLTSGIESLDIEEIAYWKTHVQAGNLYVNRPTTGAIVLRQPFGGIKKSAIGAGIKAGGPNYVQQFANIEELNEPTSALKKHALIDLVAKFLEESMTAVSLLQEQGFSHKLKKATQSYAYEYEHHFSKKTDYFHLRGEENFFQYRPAGDILILLRQRDTLFDACAMVLAASIVNNKVTIGLHGFGKDAVEKIDLLKRFVKYLKNVGEQGTPLIKLMSEDEILQEIKYYERCRVASKDNVFPELQYRANQSGKHIFSLVPKMDGRLELLNYVYEQSISEVYHRYGNLGIRGIRNKVLDLKDQDLSITQIPDRKEPTNILLSSPKFYDVIDRKNIHMTPNKVQVNKKLALDQWNQIKRIYETLLGKERIKAVDGVKRLEDMVFCANQSFPWVVEGQKKVIMSNMVHDSRKMEVPHFDSFFRQENYEVLYLSTDEPFEGMGDMIPHPGKQLLYGGYGKRSSLHAYKELSQVLKTPIIPLELVDDRFYHLDTCFLPLSEDVVMICSQAFSSDSLKVIKKIFRRVIDIPLKEASENLSLNANAITSEKIAIMQAGSPVTSEALRNEGFNVFEVNTSEYLKSGGSVFCMKMMYY